MEAGILTAGLVAGLCALSGLLLTLLKENKRQGLFLASSALLLCLLTLLTAWWGYRQEITAWQEAVNSMALTDSLFKQMSGIASAGSLLGLALMSTTPPLLLGFFTLAFGLTIPAEKKNDITSLVLTALGASSALFGVGFLCVSFLTYLRADAFFLALIRWWT